MRDLSPARAVTDAFANPLFAATYALKSDTGLRLAVSGGLVAPIGMGGGPDPGRAPGVSIGYVRAGLAVQGEATLFYLAKTHDEAIGQVDTQKTNATYGVQRRPVRRADVVVLGRAPLRTVDRPAARRRDRPPCGAGRSGGVLHLTQRAGFAANRAASASSALAVSPLALARAAETSAGVDASSTTISAFDAAVRRSPS